MDSKYQVDVLLFNFSKAFDTVSHRKLLTKFAYHGIQDCALQWISTWLTNRMQRVLIEGVASKEVSYPKYASGHPVTTDVFALYTSMTSIIIFFPLPAYLLMI